MRQAPLAARSPVLAWLEAGTLCCHILNCSALDADLKGQEAHGKKTHVPTLAWVTANLVPTKLFGCNGQTRSTMSSPPQKTLETSYLARFPPEPQKASP